MSVHPLSEDKHVTSLKAGRGESEASENQLPKGSPYGICCPKGFGTQWMFLKRKELRPFVEETPVKLCPISIRVSQKPTVDMPLMQLATSAVSTKATPGKQQTHVLLSSHLATRATGAYSLKESGI